MLVEHDAKRLKYYWFDKTIKTHEINLSSEPEDQEKLEKIISLQFGVLKAENVFSEQWTQIGTTNYLMEINNKDIYIIAVADWKDYLSSKLWKHVIDVFAENWSWTLETNERKDILEIPSPSDAIENGDFYWATPIVACCRVMNDGGFYTGYGDPYESTVFYELIADMAASCYEKRISKGIIVPLCGEADPDVSFSTPVLIDMSNCRAMRKYLEMARDGFALAVEDDGFVGLVSDSGFTNRIEILGENQWRYCENGEIVFSVNNRKISVSTPLSDNNMILGDQLIDAQDEEVIKTIAKVAVNQGHGTTIIFTDEAESESKRLSKYNRCQLISPISLSQNTKLIVPLTSIDGAIIVGLDGECYGIGAILDGEAVKAGNIGRGARYNSALNYVAWRKTINLNHKYYAIVISEDGIINVITTKNVDMISDDSEGLIT